MKINLNDAKAFLIGAGFGSVISNLHKEEIIYLTIGRLKKMGINAEYTDEHN